MQDARFHTTGPVRGCPWQLVGPICFEAARSRYVTSMVHKSLNSPMPCYRTNHEPIILSNYPSFVAKNTRPLVTTFIDLYKKPMNPLDNKINACISLLSASAGRICWKRFPCKMVSRQGGKFLQRGMFFLERGCCFFNEPRALLFQSSKISFLPRSRPVSDRHHPPMLSKYCARCFVAMGQQALSHRSRIGKMQVEFWPNNLS